MKKFFKNNKGFTLVELIIVIAIIAVLAAVAAPQYIKYVERSRNATLEAAASAAIDIVKAEGALGNIKLDGNASTEDKIVFANNSITVSGLTYAGDLVGADADASLANFKALLGGEVDCGATVDYTIIIQGTGTQVTNAVKDTNNWG